MMSGDALAVCPKLLVASASPVGVKGALAAACHKINSKQTLSITNYFFFFLK